MSTSATRTIVDAGRSAQPHSASANVGERRGILLRRRRSRCRRAPRPRARRRRRPGTARSPSRRSTSGSRRGRSVRHLTARAVAPEGRRAARRGSRGGHARLTLRDATDDGRIDAVPADPGRVDGIPVHGRPAGHTVSSAEPSGRTQRRRTGVEPRGHLRDWGRDETVEGVGRDRRAGPDRQGRRGPRAGHAARRGRPHRSRHPARRAPARRRHRRQGALRLGPRRGRRRPQARPRRPRPGAARSSGATTASSAPSAASSRVSAASSRCRSRCRPTSSSSTCSARA